MLNSHKLVEPILADVEYCGDWVEERHAGTKADNGPVEGVIGSIDECTVHFLTCIKNVKILLLHLLRHDLPLQWILLILLDQFLLISSISPSIKQYPGRYQALRRYRSNNLQHQCYMYRCPNLFIKVNIESSNITFQNINSYRNSIIKLKSIEQDEQGHVHELGVHDFGEK